MDLVKFRQSLTTSPLQMPREAAGEDPTADLLKLVEEVTKDDDDRLPIAAGSSSMPFNGSFNSMPNGSIGFLPPHGLVTISPGIGPHPPPIHPPRYEEVAGANGSFVGAWNGSPEGRDGAAANPFASSPEPPGAAPLFPRMEEYQPKFTKKVSPIPGSAPAPPPPPPGGAPPPFAAAVASMNGNSPIIASTSASSRIPETLIVRNEHGVFLLQPMGGSPVVGAAHPPRVGASPPSYGAPHNQRPPAYNESPASTNMLPPPYALPPPGPTPLGSSTDVHLPPPPPPPTGLPPPYVPNGSMTRLPE